MYFDPILAKRIFELNKNCDLYYEELNILKNEDRAKKKYEKQKWRKICKCIKWGKK